MRVRPPPGRRRPDPIGGQTHAGPNRRSKARVEPRDDPAQPRGLKAIHLVDHDLHRRRSISFSHHSNREASCPKFNNLSRRRRARVTRIVTERRYFSVNIHITKVSSTTEHTAIDITAQAVTSLALTGTGHATPLANRF
jgi:hypothetical protein